MNLILYPEQELKRRAMRWAIRLRVKPEALRFDTLTDKWGYCSASREVVLSLDLLNQDARFQDYVIVHELLHLRIRSHGKRFNAVISAHFPDWRNLENQSCATGLPIDSGVTSHSCDMADAKCDGSATDIDLRDTHSLRNLG